MYPFESPPEGCLDVSSIRINVLGESRSCGFEPILARRVWFFLTGANEVSVGVPPIRLGWRRISSFLVPPKGPTKKYKLLKVSPCPFDLTNSKKNKSIFKLKATLRPKDGNPNTKYASMESMPTQTSSYRQSKVAATANPKWKPLQPKVAAPAIPKWQLPLTQSGSYRQPKVLATANPK